MPNFASQFSTGKLATLTSPAAGVVVAQDLFIDVTAAQLVVGNIFDIGILPAGHAVTDFQLACDDLDSNGTPTLAVDVGIMSGTPGDVISARTSGNELIAGSAAAQAASLVRMSSQNPVKLIAVGFDRSIGVKVTVAPATAAAGRLRLRVLMHCADTTVQF